MRAAGALRNADDTRLLLTQLGVRAVDAVTDIVARYFPDEPPSERSRLLLEDILAGNNNWHLVPGAGLEPARLFRARGV